MQSESSVQTMSVRMSIGVSAVFRYTHRTYHSRLSSHCLGLSQSWRISVVSTPSLRNRHTISPELSTSVTNPAFKTEELLPQLREARPHVLFVHQESLSNVREACLGCDLSLDSIILFDPPNNAFCPRSTENPKTVEDLIQFGLKHEKCHQFKERKLCKGEGLKKMAFLFPSSGTTGIPKLIQLSHYAFIANVLQAVVHDAGSASNPIPFERRRHHPGDVTCARTSCVLIERGIRRLTFTYKLFPSFMSLVF